MDNTNFDTFGLSNFKTFKEFQDIELAPITLIYGQNSGGKSTLLSSLMCVGQSIDEIDKGYFKTNGYLYDAGTFDTIRNFDDRDKDYITIELKSKIPNRENKTSEFVYLKTLEYLLYPKFKLFIARNQENRSKLIIKKIEIHYEGNFSGYKLIFKSSNIPISRKTSRGYIRFRKLPRDLINPKVFELEENSIKELNEISNKALKNISDEIKKSISNIENSKLCTDGVFISRPEPGRYEDSFYRVESPLSSNGLIKIAGILAGGWISNRFGRYKFTKFNGRNKSLLDLIRNYVINISNKNFEFYENNNYIPSFFIDSSLENSKSASSINHLNIKFIENIRRKISQSKIKEINKIKETFFEESLLLISKENDQFQDKEIKKIEIVNQKIKNTIIFFKKELENIEKESMDNNKLKIDYLINLEFQLLESKLNEFVEDIENHEKLNSLFYFGFQMPKELINSPGPKYYDIIGEKFEILSNLRSKTNEISEEFSNLLSRINEIQKLALNKDDQIIKIVNNFDLAGEIIDIIEYFEICEYNLNLILKNTHEVYKCLKIVNKIDEEEIEIIIDKKILFYELMCFLLDIQIDRERTLNYRAGSFINNNDILYKKSNLFNDPLFSTTFIPYKLSQKIIHLRAFREAAKRAYSIDDINSKNVNDVAFLITILEKEKDTLFIKRLEEDLKKLEIADTIYTKSSIDSKYDFKSIILKQTNKKEVNIVDTGYGISQMLPIIIHSNTSENNTLIIQQPETHIHPRLQAELASIICRSCIKPEILKSNYFDYGRGNKNFIIETHSETILLRLLKEIRNGNFKQENLKVFYIDKNEKGSEIIEMDISEDGELISQWPEGFFSTELNEMMD